MQIRNQGFNFTLSTLCLLAGLAMMGFSSHWATAEDSTASVSVQATCQTLTGFLARAEARKQTFDTFDDFVRAAQTGELKMAAPSDPDWLPPGQLSGALADLSKEDATWSMLPPDAEHHIGHPRIAAELSDQTRIVGNYAPKGIHGWTVWCEVDDLVPVMTGPSLKHNC